MKIHRYILALAFIAGHALASPPETAKTNSPSVSMTAAHIADLHEALDSPRTPSGFWSTARDQFEIKSTQNAVDRLESPTARLQLMNSSFEGYSANAEYSSMGHRLFTSSLRDAARETLASTLPTDEWADWVTDLFVGAIGHTDERNIRYASAAPSIGESLWMQDGSNRHFDHGVRIDGNAYLRGRFGRAGGKDSLVGNRPLITFMMRYAYDPFTFGNLGFQCVAPLPFSLELASSCSIRMSDISSVDRNLSYAIRLQRVNIVDHSFSDLFFVGLQSNDSFMPAGIRRPGNNPIFALGLSTRSWPWKR